MLNNEIWVWVPNDIQQLTLMTTWCFDTLGNKSVGEHPWDIRGFDTKSSIVIFHKHETLLMFKLAWGDFILDELAFFD